MFNTQVDSSNTLSEHLTEVSKYIQLNPLNTDSVSSNFSHTSSFLSEFVDELQLDEITNFATKFTWIPDDISIDSIPIEIGDWISVDYNQGNYFNFNPQTSDGYIATESSPSSSTPENISTAQSRNFNNNYGYGLIDAAAAVAKAIGYSRFADVPNQSDEYDWGLDAISVPEVWNQGYSGENIVVAVVDSGVDFRHADLNDNIWFNSGEIFDDGIDNDGNGYIDDIIGWDFVSNDYNPIGESNDHGTHVAGIIAAEADGYGINGVAYNAKIMPVRVLDEGGHGNDINIANGIYYAANNGANVINLSLGGEYSSNIEAAVKYATERGAIVIMSSGNDGKSEPGYPAALATNWGIAVGAIDYNWNVADFSNQAGSDSRINYVVAPGVDIYSTISGDDYDFMNGTSMAAPYVSGVAALMLSANPYLTPQQLRQIIIETAIA
ncbi:S8 family peptidase [Calothrix sp. PCC 6303]|uniref:S8 family peptidase n=1 Tax=Calothrix sp. PCC 6303 TaxID=1170562 RepID=UPI0002A05801|nr:S8 family peptidase [Calothrix sp. PCC 6303]AFZ03959.1 Subtilisin [Calothrix sp. PCC 6303]